MISTLEKRAAFSISIFLMLIIAPFSKALAFSGPGTGTSGDPYVIANCVQLQEMSNDLTASYELANNINCADTANWNGGEGFVPIGDNTTPFTGSLEGNNHTILDLFISNANTDYQGLFGDTQGGTISDVSIAGTITGGNYTGGLIGYASQETVTNDHSTVTVTGKDSTGGLIGNLLPNGVGTVSGSSYSGAVSGNNNVGGLIGETFATTMHDTHLYVQTSYSTGSVSGISAVGGLIGFVSNGGLFEDSYSQSTIIQSQVGQDGFGGLIGLAGAATIERTYASGHVNASTNGGSESIGGLVGGIMAASGNESISDSFSAVVAGNASVGGFYGGDESAGEGNELSLTDNYYDLSNSGTASCYTTSAQNETGCAGITINESTYWKNTANNPLSQWSTSIWNIGTYALPVLTTYVAPDTTPPTVVSVSPANTQTGVAGNVPIVITFSESMDTSSVQTATGGCTTDCPSFNQVWSNNDTILTLTHTGFFDPDTTFGFQVQTARDVTQNNIVAPYSFSFTTGSAATLTEVTPIPQQVLASAAIYHFTTSESCSPEALPVQGPGNVELFISPTLTPNTDLTAYFSGLQAGGTYSGSFQCINQNEVLSNALTIGPFAVIADPTNSGSISGGNPNITWTPETGTVYHTQSAQVSSPSIATTSLVSAQTKTRTLRLGMSGPDVTVLQVYLNTHKFLIASSGPGSPGHETTMFGSLTKKAVMKFQTAQGLSPDGIVGPKTRALIF